MIRTAEFLTPEEADRRDRDWMLSLSPQERLDYMIGLVGRWGNTDERRLERVLVFVEQAWR